MDLDHVVDERERKALEGIISNFGQTPCQLLKVRPARRIMVRDAHARPDRPLVHRSHIQLGSPPRKQPSALHVWTLTHLASSSTWTSSRPSSQRYGEEGLHLPALENGFNTTVLTNLLGQMENLNQGHRCQTSLKKRYQERNRGAGVGYLLCRGPIC